MTVPLLDLTRQYATVADDVQSRMQEVIRRQAFILGDTVEEFEGAMAELVGVRHAIGVASGTDALLLPLKALDLRPGEEVIAPAFTFFATAGAIHNAGGRPVFVDIDPVTFNLSPDAVEVAITPRTRAIVPVHLFGQMADMAPLQNLAQQHDIFLLEDGAQALGAMQEVEGQWFSAGALGGAGAFSFFPSKNLGGFGDGGMVTTGDEVLAGRIRRLRVHGGLKMYHHDEVGTNSRLDALQAAVLHAKLPHLSMWGESRAAHAAWYNERFTPLQDRGLITTPASLSKNRSVYNQYTLRARDRDGLRAHLKAAGVGSGVYYPVPLHLQPCFAELGFQEGDLPETEKAAGEVLSLPVFPELTHEERSQVAWAVEEFYA